MTQLYLPYIVTEIYCMAFAFTVLLYLNTSVGSEQEIRQLRNMVFSYFVMLVTDIGWALVENGSLVLNSFWNGLMNAVSIMSVALGCYFWFRFVEYRLHPAYSGWKFYRYFRDAPVILICAADLISVFTKWLFYIDAGGHYITTNWFVLQGVVDYVYLLVPTILSLLWAFRSHSHMRRTEYLIYSLYMVAPLASGIMEDSMPTIPVLALNIFLVILLFFLMLQNMQIYNDALTDLNNRRRLNQFLEDRLKDASPEHPLILFMMDINDFKSINDTLGHVEGDRALVAFAGVLQKLANRHDAFLARYGGDEFCLVSAAAKCGPAEIEAELGASLQSLTLRSPGGRQYGLSVSVGHTLCDTPEFNPAAAIGRADAMLYANKQKWHAEKRELEKGDSQNG